jgi:TrpR-related protein YerC/YecD
MDTYHHHTNEISLYEAILSLKNPAECQRFFADLWTPQELRAFQERWRVCQLLDRGTYSYREIHKMAAASLTTIGRVARCLKEEKNHGYRLVLDRRKRIQNENSNERNYT